MSAVFDKGFMCEAENTKADLLTYLTPQQQESKVNPTVERVLPAFCTVQVHTSAKGKRAKYSSVLENQGKST